MKLVWILGVFLYVLVSGLFVQFLLIPRYLPALDNGTGLMSDGDSVEFHRFAEKQAAAIRDEGWSAWTLRPGGHSPAGIASAVYVLAGVSRPWALLPVNAALWAFSAWMLFLILRPLVGSDFRAMLCALPFVLAPSALLFLTQIYKDTFIVAGAVVVWFALTRLMSVRTTALSPAGIMRPLAWMTGGLVLLWVGRPYTMFLSLPGYGVIGAGLLLADLMQKRISANAWCVLVLSVMICFGMMRTGATQEYAKAGVTAPRWVKRGAAKVDFRPSCLGPLDAPFRRMATMRNIYLVAYPHAGSKLDEDVILDSSWSVLAYTPRALQLLVMAPFPATWIREGTANSFALLVYAETAARYLLFPGLIWLCWVKRRSMVYWMPWLFFVPWGVIYAITTPNLGTLVRVRFPLVMMFASLGAVGTVMLREAWRKRGKCG